jgi:hypothetical protein
VLLLKVLKRPQTQSNDLHSILFKTFPKLPFWLAERQHASPFLTLPANFASLELGPSNGAIFSVPIPCLYIFWAWMKPLEEPPHEVCQQREQQQHEHPTNPNQKIQSHLRRVDLFFVHASR